MSESTANAKEPSMEDILASIRRIIDEEESRDGGSLGSDEETLDRLNTIPGDDSGQIPVMAAASGNGRDVTAETAEGDGGDETIFPERESLFWSRATGRNIPVPPYIKPTEGTAKSREDDASDESDAPGESDIFARARSKLDSNSRLSPRERMQALAARAESRSEAAAAEIKDTVSDEVQNLDTPDLSNVETFGASDTNEHTDSDADVLELTSGLSEAENQADGDFVAAYADAPVSSSGADDVNPEDQGGLKDRLDSEDEVEPEQADAQDSDDHTKGFGAGLATAAAAGLGLDALRKNAADKAADVSDKAEGAYRGVFEKSDDSAESAAESFEAAAHVETAEAVDMVSEDRTLDAKDAPDEVFDLTDRLDQDEVHDPEPTVVSEPAAASNQDDAEPEAETSVSVANDGIDPLTPHSGLYGRGDDDIPDTRDEEEVVDVTDMKIDTPDVSDWNAQADADEVSSDDAPFQAADVDESESVDHVEAADLDENPSDADAAVRFPDTYGASDVYHDDPPPLDDDYSASFTENTASTTSYAGAGAAVAGAAAMASATSSTSSSDDEDLEAVGGMVRDAMEREPLDYAEPQPSALVSMTSEEISARALASLSDPDSEATRRVYGALRLTDEKGSQSLEGMMREMLQPMLREWLDDNLPNVVEGIVRGEVERISAKSHRYKSDSKD